MELLYQPPATKQLLNGKDYVHTATLKGHSNFVSSVCVINPTERNPTGFIITGSNDKTICIYVPDQIEPVNILKAHQDTVCKLRTGKKEGTFLSSSWDLSAKLWNTNDLSKPQLNLVGHTAAVWCVSDLLNGSIITGSADKLVIVWTEDGSIHHKLSGHTDCVRDICVINSNEFLTCSNDATVRHWNASLGSCLGTYNGHENYIYSILAKDNGTSVFTSGEDRTIRVWHNSEISQTITLPTQSVWCIDLFPNGDIVAGSSDGIVRIFSCDPERYADEKALQEFEQETAKTKLNAQLELGGIKIKDLPGTNALEEPGQRDGQTKIVNDGNIVSAYSWSQNEQRWIKIGDVMGATGGTAATSGKRLHNGVEYDYVFSVDIQDGVPPLKLPYNEGQDPWHVAQRFLYDNDLSQLFLDQVANFIIKNSQSAPVVNAGAQYADPFTGGNRYIPRSTANATEQEESVRPVVHNSSDCSLSPSYIPHTKYLKLEHANLSGILEKLREFNSKQNEASKVSDDKLDSLVTLTASQASEQSAADVLSTFKILLNWPDDVLFPVLDITRLAVLYKEINDVLCTDDLLQIIKKHIKPEASASNQMLTFRLLVNMFSHEKGEKLCYNSKDEILTLLSNLKSLGSKNNQVAVSTYILNLTVALNKYNDAVGRVQCLNVMFSVLPHLNEPEALFRTLVGLGTLLYTSDSKDRSNLIKAIHESEVALNVLRTMSETNVPANTTNKLANCSKQIISLIF
ncbi:phospholipase A-2-activating protein isoform X2 [Hylaeus anthracinus]|uniref:phospholipase A-2-activating protein isoform X2 n=1 Tax=Hylaeus volcanicus TaxID=313075 RepID=UPI0023B81473|nr:phospholipase A-2-activating protein isoform X2 [Hylaeus volcanicus]XP_054015595.1 phospholipase A-2-activating protein isoform X2 [Hylaeus anthracinus]